MFQKFALVEAEGSLEIAEGWLGEMGDRSRGF